MSSEEEKGFVIRDKRGKTEPDPEPASHEQGAEVQSDENAQPQPPGPPVTFSSFVFSLGTSALMLMGESLDPQKPSIPVNIPQAKEMIDILSMLEQKTQGNLSSDESAVLGDMLYTLRMKYVDATSGKPTPTSP